MVAANKKILEEPRYYILLFLEKLTAVALLCSLSRNLMQSMGWGATSGHGAQGDFAENAEVVGVV